MNELSFFTGCGGGVYASKILGHRVVGYVEIAEYPQRIIRARIEDGTFDNAPIFGDLRTFISEGYAERYKGMVDIISGGFPCQDISSAGSGKGLEGERSGLWREFAEAIRIIEPRLVFVENSPMLTIRGLGTILSNLAQMGYDAKWGVLGSYNVELPTPRERLWILASAVGFGLERNREDRADGRSMGRPELSIPKTSSDILRKFLSSWNAGGVYRSSDGYADWKHRVKAAGNGQVPALAATAFRQLNAV